MSKDLTRNLFGEEMEAEVSGGYVVRVVIEDTAVEGCFDYIVPEKLWPVGVGARVEVPFGRGNKKKNGFCVAVDVEKEKKVLRLKAVSKVLERTSLLNDRLIELARWISSYYVCPLGVVISAMIPAAVKKSIGVKTEKLVYLTGGAESLRGAKQKKVFEILEKENALDAESGVEQNELLSMAECTAAVIKKLGERKVIKIAPRKVVKALPVIPEGLAVDFPDKITLNEDQEQALEHINGEIEKERFGVSVLYGVTDSGKTEVYIRAIQKAIDARKSAIVLLPEIALTAQTVQRFKHRFENIAVMHSGLTAAQRNVQWQNIRSGKANVVIGARSAVFAPMENLGLIVVDEEHESSYKQDTAPRYNGRDVAVKRGHIEGAHVVLGSATPSLESLYNCQHREHYTLLSMPKRVKNFAMPKMRLIDLAKTGGYSKDKGIELISDNLKEHLKGVLDRGEQAILLLNRRGYSNYVFCPSCKHTLHCRNCDVSLTFHKSPKIAKGNIETIMGKMKTSGLAICHYCFAKTLVPEVCPLCKTKMIMIGLGAQRLEEQLSINFPNANVARIDSDSMQSKDYYKLMKDFGERKIDILAGTQMLAKGLHFPNVTLVGIISADTSLCLPDFRANEKTFQLIRQVAGRSGRGEKEGTVFVQTFYADQPVLKFAMNNDFKGFIAEEFKHRKACGLPPFGKLAIILLRDEKFDRLGQHSEYVKQQIDWVVASKGLELTVKGPMPASIARIQRFYRNQIIIQAKSAEVIYSLFNDLRNMDIFRGSVKVAVDIDPVNLL